MNFKNFHLLDFCSPLFILVNTWTNSPELVHIINIFIQKLAYFTFVWVLTLQTSLNFFYNKGRKKPSFHGLYISLTLNLFRSIHYSKCWNERLEEEFQLCASCRDNFLGKFCSSGTQRPHVHKLYRHKLSTFHRKLICPDGCRRSGVIIRFKISLGAQHLSAPGRIMPCTCIFPSCIIRASHI